VFADFMANTWEAATIVAAVAGVVGFFVVLRGAAFPAHAIPNSAFAGAAGAALYGFNSLLGLAVAALAAALGIGALGRRGRQDVVTALGLVLMLALGDVFLVRSGQYEQQVYSLLFGETIGVSTTEIPAIAALAFVSMGAVALLWRRLMLSSLLPDVAEARGVRKDRVEMAFLVVLALSTAMTVPVVGALLIFSLMIGPPSAARALTDRAGVAVVASVAIALVTVWLSIAVSYETDWPVGFVVGAFGALMYGTGRAVAGLRRYRALPR
jgi:zinc/manganese transport system permease protein